jgi:hypothetical protein
MRFAFFAETTVGSPASHYHVQTCYCQGENVVSPLLPCHPAYDFDGAPLRPGFLLSMDRFLPLPNESAWGRVGALAGTEDTLRFASLHLPNGIGAVSFPMVHRVGKPSIGVPHPIFRGNRKPSDSHCFIIGSKTGMPDSMSFC